MFRRTILIALTLLMITACGGSQAIQGGATENTGSVAQREAPAGGAQPMSAPEEVVPADDDTAGVPDLSEPVSTGGEGGAASAQQGTAPFGRMVIRTANLSLLVEDADEAERQVRALVQNVGGYVLRQGSSQDNWPLQSAA